MTKSPALSRTCRTVASSPRTRINEEALISLTLALSVCGQARVFRSALAVEPRQKKKHRGLPRHASADQPHAFFRLPARRHVTAIIALAGPPGPHPSMPRTRSQPSINAAQASWFIEVYIARTRAGNACAHAATTPSDRTTTVCHGA